MYAIQPETFDVIPERRNDRAAQTPPVVSFPLLERIGTAMQIQRGQAVFCQGDRARSFYRVVSGMVRSDWVLPDGRRYVYDFAICGEFFGVGLDGRHREGAEAVTDAVIMAFPRSLSFGTPADQRSFVRELLQVTMRKAMAAHQNMLDLGRKTAEERLATFLTSLAERVAAKAELGLPMSRMDIADHLGMTPETVSRALAKLRNAGLIESLSPTRIRLLDRSTLKAFADGFIHLSAFPARPGKSIAQIGRPAPTRQKTTPLSRIPSPARPGEPCRAVA